MVPVSTGTWRSVAAHVPWRQSARGGRREEEAYPSHRPQAPPAPSTPWRNTQMRRIALGLLAGVLVAGMIAAPVAARRAGPSIVDTAVAANSDPSSPLYQQLDTLISLVTNYGLAGTLDGNRQFTVFAPTDAAFAELFAQVDPSTL